MKRKNEEYIEIKYMKKGDFVGRNLLFDLYGRLIRLNSVDEMPGENYNLFMQMVPECIG